MIICYIYYIFMIDDFDDEKRKIVDYHNMYVQKNDNIYYSYQRAIINSLNLSVGILITAVMIFRMKK